MFTNETTDTKALRPTLICEAPAPTRTRRVRTTRSWRKAMNAARDLPESTPRKGQLLREIREVRDLFVTRADHGRSIARWYLYNILEGRGTTGSPRPVPAGWQG
jgi:hypothetical protein